MAKAWASGGAGNVVLKTSVGKAHDLREKDTDVSVKTPPASAVVTPAMGATSIQSSMTTSIPSVAPNRAFDVQFFQDKNKERRERFEKSVTSGNGKKAALKQKRVFKQKTPGGGGGQAKLIASVNDASAQAAGARDAAREMREVAAELDKENDFLLKEMETATQKLDVHEAKARSLAEQQNQKHNEQLKNFRCHWTEDDKKDGNLWFLFFTWFVPMAQIIALMIYTGQVEYLEFGDSMVYLVGSIIWLVACLMWDRHRCFSEGRSPYFFATTTKHSYEFVDLLDETHPDERAEKDRNQDLKYEAYYARFQYTVSKHHGVYRRQHNRVVSVELLVQLCANQRTMSLANSEQVTEDRMRQHAATFGCINLSRFSVLEEDVRENTVAVAMGMWKRNLRRRFGHFP
jgi:hypothetical protein